MRGFQQLFWVLLFGLNSSVALSEEPINSPYLYVLGVAQDAGYPQALCFKPHCMPAWEDKQKRRGATSLALINPAAKTTHVFEATPNMPDQLYRLHVEAPVTEFSLGGIFLTHAHMGHYAGLIHLGHEAAGDQDVAVYVMPRMAAFLTDNGPWSQLVDFGNIHLKLLTHETPVMLDEQVTVTPFLVPHRDEYSETVGYRIEGPNKSAVFIPDIDKWFLWARKLEDVLATVDYALVDATFYSGDELPGRDMSKVLHPSVEATMQLLEKASASEKAKIHFIHFNHSNPLIDPESETAKDVRYRGFNVTFEGMRLPL